MKKMILFIILMLAVGCRIGEPTPTPSPFKFKCESNPSTPLPVYEPK